MRRLGPYSWLFGIVAVALSIQACSDTPSGPDRDSQESTVTRVTRVQISGFVAAPNALNGMPWVGVVPGFRSPLDGVPSPDGSVFYFTAYTDEATPRAAIYAVPSGGGEGTLLHVGGQLVRPSGLLMSCDGRELFIADQGAVTGEEAGSSSDAGGLYRLSAAGGTVASMNLTEVARPTRLAMGNDCASLYITARDYAGSGEPALVRASTVPGLTAALVYSGDPLVSPSGVHVDADDQSWVLDQLSGSDAGMGVLYSINHTGGLQEVVGDLGMGASGGVSLDPGGRTAVIPTGGPGIGSGLRTINLTTGNQGFLPTPQVTSPSGIRTARNGPVMILVDNGGNAIYRVE